MIRKSKKSVKKGARPSGGGFGGDSSTSSDSSSSTATLSPPAWANRFPFAGDIRPGAQTEQKVVTASSIVPPDYAMDGSPKNARPMLPWVIEVKTADEIAKMRESGKLARKVLDVAGRAVKPGVTTAEIDELVHKTAVEVRFNFELRCCFEDLAHDKFSLIWSSSCLSYSTILQYCLALYVAPKIYFDATLHYLASLSLLYPGHAKHMDTNIPTQQ